MHSLEFCLLALAERIRSDTGNQELADATLSLASAAHGYIPECEENEERLATSKLARDLHVWFDKQQGSRNKPPAR
jgi:hypothetical protein